MPERYRWVVLGAGTFALTSFSAIYFGIAVLAPALRDSYGLSLGQTGVLLAATNAGSLLTLLPWGLAADRFGERNVTSVGLTLAAAALVGAAFAGSFLELLAALVGAGAAAASVNAATGRAVMHWFAREQRGLALGVRQTAVPLGGLIAAVTLPHVGSVRTALLALGGGCIAAAAAGALLLQEAGQADGGPQVPSRQTLRDRRIWRLSWGSSLLLVPQVCLVGFAVLFLHERRGLAPGSAAAVFAAVQVLGAGARVGAGRWSDRLGSRVVPLRRIALALGASVVLTALLVPSPRVVLLPVLVVAGGLAMSWNGLSFTAAAEAAGHGRSGAALGLQQTALSVTGTILPPAFGALVGATSWQAGFVLVALAPLAAWGVLGRLS